MIQIYGEIDYLRVPNGDWHVVANEYTNRSLLAVCDTELEAKCVARAMQAVMMSFSDAPDT